MTRPTSAGPVSQCLLLIPKDSANRASSQYSLRHRAQNARLNSRKGPGRSGAWLARKKNSNQWIQVDIGKLGKITGVATQGRQDAWEWVTRYILYFSNNGFRFYPYRVNGRVKASSGLIRSL